MTPAHLAEQIRHLPKLAHDAAQHSIATTHGGSDGTGIRTAPGSKVPPGVDLDRLDLGRGRQWPHLLVRVGQCIRVVLEECPGLRDTGPDLAPEGSETWAGECSWLLATMGTWWDDDWTRSFVESEVTAVGRKLRGKVERPDVDGRRRCSVCGSELVAYSSSTVDVAECRECERVVGMRARTLLTTREAAERHGVTPQSIRTLEYRGRVLKVAVIDGTSVYDQRDIDAHFGKEEAG